VRKLLLLLALCAAVVSCGGGEGKLVADPGPPDPSLSCTLDEQRASLDAWMQDQYYWYPQLSGGDGGAQDMDTYFHSMLTNPPDRYSFTQSTASFDQTFGSGWRIGYGYTLTWDAATSRLRVRNVEPASPVATAGIHRGDTVLSIDGLTPFEVTQGKSASVTTPGVERVFVLADANGVQRSVTVKSALFSIAPVATWTTLDATRGGVPVKVGYLAYHQFVQYSTWELGLAIANMAGQGVNEFVLDLRYNGGGAVITSRDLASMLGGSQTDGAVFAQLRFNIKHPEKNQDMRFMTAAERFAAPIEGLPRLFVIASGGTASASELLINGLKPFMRVVLIGERTYGKPYGFAPRSNCGTTYNAVNFEVFNGQGAGGYSNGFAVDCQAGDDLDHELGDPQERRLKEALAYIATGRCSAQAPQSAELTPTRPREFGERVPPGMFLR
jgi:C-terminal processing protease CtpA/Prc